MRLVDADALKSKMTVDALGGHKRIWACGVIDDAPTIDAQPVKHGKWIPMDEYHAKCSVCGWWQKTNGKCCTGHANIHKAVYKYCTACGSKMDGDEN